MAIRWENVGRGMAVASQEEANWVAAQRAPGGEAGASSSCRYSSLPTWSTSVKV